MDSKKWALCLAAVSVHYAGGLPAFPGAEGWGAETPGGRGGRVYVVTTTASTGVGSLYNALIATGPRIIVFRVSGVINLQPAGQWYFYAQNANRSNFTVAGQTSPGGVTLTVSGGASPLFSYHSGLHDVVFRHLRFRPPASGHDGISWNGVHNFIFDHCDFSGAGDETLDLTSDSNFTVQWSTITNSGVCSGCQTYGALIAYLPTSKITLHHNLFAHHIYRTPQYHWDGQAPPNRGLIDHRNNVSYNFRDNFLYLDPYGSQIGGPLDINYVGNYNKSGPNTDENGGRVGLAMNGTGVVNMYVSDNPRVFRDGSRKASIGTGSAASTHAVPQVTTQPADEAYQLVLDKVGALPRDAMNTRTIDEVKNGTGGFGKLDDPMITAGPQPPADADLDGMPDAWETSKGLNPDDSSDSRGDYNGDGYTNIEKYINDLALVLEGQPPLYVSLEDSRRLRGLTPGGLSIAPSVYSGQGVLRIALSGRASGKVKITDLRGRVVAEFPARPEILCEGRGLPPGVFAVRWTLGGRNMAMAKLTVIR